MQGKPLGLLGPAKAGIASAHMQSRFSERLLPVSGWWTFLCLCHRTCACMCMKPPYMCLRASPVGLAWRVDLQQQEGILGEAIEGLGFQGRDFSIFTLAFRFFSPSSGLLNYREWTEEIGAWGLGVVGACAVSVATRARFLLSSAPLPLLSSLGGRPSFLVLLLPSGGHQENDRPKRRGHGAGTLDRGCRSGLRKDCGKSQESGGTEVL